MEKEPDAVDKHVGARVTARRQELGLTQVQLGKALGLTFQQVGKYETAANRISSSKLHQTAAFLKVPISYFFEGLDEMQAAEVADPAYARRLRYIQTVAGASAVDALIEIGEAFAKAVAGLRAELDRAREKGQI